MHFSVVHRVFGKDAALAIHQVVVPEIGCGEELEVHSGLAYQLCRNRLVKPYLYQDTLVFGNSPKPGRKTVIGIVERHFDAALGFINPAGAYRSEDVPLLGCVHQTDAAAGGDADSALDDFQAGEFLIVKTTVVNVVVHKHICAASLVITEVVEFHALCVGYKRQCGCNNRNDHN